MNFNALLKSFKCFCSLDNEVSEQKCLRMLPQDLLVRVHSLFPVLLWECRSYIS